VLQENKGVNTYYIMDTNESDILCVENEEIKKEKLTEEDVKLLEEPSSKEKEKSELPEKPNNEQQNQSPVQSMNEKPKYVSQYELVSYGQGLLLCESYYEQTCVWLINEGCFKMYIPWREIHDRQKEWYRYPAARIFFGERPLCVNLELNKSLKGVFSNKDLKWEGNYLHMRYKKQRKKGIVLQKGMLLGYLYIHEPWFPRTTNYVTNKPVYDKKYGN